MSQRPIRGWTYRVGASLSMDQLKRDARRLKNSTTELTYTQCLELVAARAGYDNYRALQNATTADGRFTIKSKT